MIRVVIISDVRLYREGLKEILNNENSVNIVGMAYDFEEAVSEITRCAPDVVLVDMTMLASNAMVSHIMSSCPQSRVVALAVSEDEESIMACAKAGIMGYVSREASLEQLLKALCGVVKGELYCPRRIAANLINKFKSLPQAETPKSSPQTSQPQLSQSKMALLTQRERQIAALLSDGLSNKQIARNLTIEVSTVKNHVHNILTKMGVTSRIQVVTLLQCSLSSE